MAGPKQGVRRTLESLTRWPRPGGEEWVDILCASEPWGAVPDGRLPRWLDHSVWWPMELPARVGIRHAQLRSDRARALVDLAGRYADEPDDVRAFLQGAEGSALPVHEAVDALLQGGGEVEPLRPLLEVPEAVARLREVARGGAGLGDAAVTALLLVHQDPERDSIIMEASLASHWELRAVAQPGLATVDGAFSWAVKQLGKGSADRRAHAAALVARLGEDGAAEALIARLAKEKIDRVRVALLEGLERLGRDVAEVLDRDAVVAETMAMAKKKGSRPKGLDVEALPVLRWSDGSDVPLELVDAWVATSHKRKKPVPTPMLTVLARGLEPTSAAAFALALFRFWVVLDNTDTDPYWGHQKGTATADKGLFAVVGALGDDTIVDEVRAYVTAHYGWRSAQCKAMLAMLAHMQSDRAIQYLLEVAARFRTRGIQLAAKVEVSKLAERRGWSFDVLADRTLGEAGLSDEPLVYVDAEGAPVRSFRLQLSEELALVVVDETGVVSKGLPKARVGEEVASEKGAKRRLTAARKELRHFVKVQTGRLREAMLRQRSWSPEVWRIYVGHPVAGHLARRLLWRVGEVVFRLEEDGSLVDVDDEPVHLSDDDEVQLAHPLVAGAGEGARWARHLADFEVLPLFPQLERPVWRVEDPKAQTIPCGARGSAFTLRSTARRLGYELSSAGDGGTIHALERDHPGLDLSVELHVEGLRHPIEDVPVTLSHALFVRRGSVVPVGRVPAVLASEVHADLEELAAALIGASA